MEVLKLSFSDLWKYHNDIPMIKSGQHKVEFTSNTTMQLIKTIPFQIDMTRDESIDLWFKILNEDTTLIEVISVDNIWVAGAITVTHSPMVNMAQGDLANAVLWDIRVSPKHQNKGYASILMRNSINFAKDMKTSRLLIETQDNNPKAISFYRKHGATLLKSNKDIYPEKLNEIQYIMQINL